MGRIWCPGGGIPVDAMLAMYEALTGAPGPSGYEEPVRQVVRKYLEPVSDELISDHLGSLAGVKVGRKGGPRVMLAAHLDEVGWMVTAVTRDGFLKFQPLGGWWSQVMLAHRVKVLTRKGEVHGLIGSKPPHILTAEERNKVVPMKEMFIDIGAGSKEEALEFGVRPGDPIVPVADFALLANPKVMMAKAWDDRAGLAIMLAAMQQLKGEAHDNVVYAAATVQEEVGLRGAITMAHRIEPDIGIALDVGIAGDTPGVKDAEAPTRLGQGPTIVLYDATMVPHLALRNLVCDTAEELGIPFQYDVLPGGGTDAGKMHLWGAGVPSIVIGIPTRYIHSHYSLAHRDDLENAAKLVVGLVKRLDEETVRRIKDQRFA
jgi:putative aminopeptidase FrvX